MSFKEFIELEEKNFRNHGGDRSSMHSSIKRTYKTSKKPFMGLIHHQKKQKPIKTSFFS